MIHSSQLSTGYDFHFVVLYFSDLFINGDVIKFIFGKLKQAVVLTAYNVTR